MIWENSIETCLLSYVKQITSPGSMHKTGCSELVHWDDPEGWDGEGGWRRGQDGGHMYTHGWFLLMSGKNHYKYCKVISLQWNKFLKNQHSLEKWLILRLRQDKPQESCSARKTVVKIQRMEYVKGNRNNMKVPQWNINQVQISVNNNLLLFIN